eukprot:2954911-Amphidinium_carterae.1
MVRPWIALLSAAVSSAVVFLPFRDRHAHKRSLPPITPKTLFSIQLPSAFGQEPNLVHNPHLLPD